MTLTVSQRIEQLRLEIEDCERCIAHWTRQVEIATERCRRLERHAGDLRRALDELLERRAGGPALRRSA